MKKCTQSEARKRICSFLYIRSTVGFENWTWNLVLGWEYEKNMSTMRNVFKAFSNFYACIKVKQGAQITVISAELIWRLMFKN